MCRQRQPAPFSQDKTAGRVIERHDIEAGRYSRGGLAVGIVRRGRSRTFGRRGFRCVAVAGRFRLRALRCVRIELDVDQCGAGHHQYGKHCHPGQEGEAAEFYALGADELFFISAAHSRGVEELLDQVVARLPERDGAATKLPDLKLALIGRPNVGKSSLLNRLSGFDRAIVDDTPGTTRDPVDVRLSAQGREVLLIDTAGI